MFLTLSLLLKDHHCRPKIDNVNQMD